MAGGEGAPAGLAPPLSAAAHARDAAASASRSPVRRSGSRGRERPGESQAAGVNGEGGALGAPGIPKGGVPPKAGSRQERRNAQRSSSKARGQDPRRLTYLPGSDLPDGSLGDVASPPLRAPPPKQASGKGAGGLVAHPKRTTLIVKVPPKVHPNRSATPQRAGRQSPSPLPPQLVWPSASPLRDGTDTITTENRETTHQDGGKRGKRGQRGSGKGKNAQAKAKQPPWRTQDLGKGKSHGGKRR